MKKYSVFFICNDSNGVFITHVHWQRSVHFRRCRHHNDQNRHIARKMECIDGFRMGIPDRGNSLRSRFQLNLIWIWHKFVIREYLISLCQIKGNQKSDKMSWYFYRSTVISCCEKQTNPYNWMQYKQWRNVIQAQTHPWMQYKIPTIESSQNFETVFHSLFYMANCTVSASVKLMLIRREWPHLNCLLKFWTKKSQIKWPLKGNLLETPTMLFTHVFECVNANQKMRFQMKITVRRFDQPNAIEHLCTRVGHVHHCNCTTKWFNKTATVCICNIVGEILRNIFDNSTISDASATISIES